MGLDVTGLGAVSDLVNTAINKIWPDKSEQDKQQLTVALTQFGYAAASNIHIDIDNLYNAARTVGGVASVYMPSKVAFV